MVGLHLGQFKPGAGHELVDGPVEVAAPEDTALQRCEPVLQAGHLLLGCQAVLQEVQGAARTQHPLNGRGVGKPTAARWPSVLRLKIAAVACRKRTVHAALRKAPMFTDADAGGLPR